MFAIIRPHRIDFGEIQDFPKASWDRLLDEIGAARAPGRAEHDQRILFAVDQAFVFVWTATNSQLKEIFHRFGVTAYTEGELKMAGETNRPAWPRDSVKQQPVDLSGRHQCHIYDGSPSRGLAKMAAAVRYRIDQGYRCLYLNSPPMILGMKNQLASTGTDVEAEIYKTSLVLSSDQNHIVDGPFNVNEMMDSIEDAVVNASADGFKGLWAAGDITWEFGSEENFTELLTYEWSLEELFRRQPTLSGVCQYHVATVPRQALHQGLLSHKTVFVNETENRLNPHYMRGDSPADTAAKDPLMLDEFITELCLLDG
jgi:hypothetical protein